MVTTRWSPRVHNMSPKKLLITEGTLIRAEEGPKALASPLTAYTVQVNFSLAVAEYTLGGYNWRHRGNF